jgi:outer membrane protein assembly factor BamB
MKQNRLNRKSNKKFKFFKFFYLLLLVVLIIAFLPKSKTKNWQFYTDDTNAVIEEHDNLVFGENHIIFNNKSGETFSIDKKNGSINWQFSAENYSPYPPVIDLQQILLANFDGNIYSLSKESGYKNWQFHIKGAYQPDTPLILSENNNLAFFAGRNGVLYAIDKTDGELIWSQQFRGMDNKKAFKSQGVDSIHFGKIYLNEEEIYAVNAVEKSFTSLDQKSGEINWKLDNIDFIWTSPIFFADNIILLQINKIISIDKKLGNIKQTTIKENPESQNWIWRIFKIGNDEQHLLIQSDQTLTKISKNLEEIIWQKFSVDSFLFNTELALIFTQQHLRLENQNNFTAIDYENGDNLWSIKLNSEVLCQLHSDEDLLIGEKNGNVISLDHNSGQINWQIRVDGSVNEIYLIGDKFLVLSHKAGNKIELTLLKKDGQILWQYVPDFLVNLDEIYEHEGAIYLLDKGKKILNKIIINEINPIKQNTRKVNFVQTKSPIYDQYDFDSYSNVKEKKNYPHQFREYWQRIYYIMKRLKNISEFELMENHNSGIFEISLKHDENLYFNVFKDIEIEATFVNPELGNIKVKGFYYDKDTWKIRLAAPISGNYDYKIKISSPYYKKTLTGSKFLEQAQKNKITVTNDFFTINNEKVFFPIGIQNTFFDKNYDGHSLDEIANSLSNFPVEQVDQFSYTDFNNYLNIYENEAKINIFRYGIGHWSPALINSIDHKDFSLNLTAGKFADEVVHTLKNKDIKIMMSIFDFYPPYKNKEEIAQKKNQLSVQLYLDYVIARFGAFVDLWELSNEAEASPQWYQFVINYLKKNDPYNHPITTNWQTNSAKNLDFQSLHHYVADVTYPGLLASEINSLVDRSYDPTMPILISELGFRNYSWFEGSAESMRVLSWISTMQNIGIIFWNQGQNKVYKNPDNANIYLGPIERSYLSILNQFLPEDLHLPVEKRLFLITELETQIYLLKNKDYILAYLLKFDKDKQKEEYLHLDLIKNGKIEWIDPRTKQIVEEYFLTKGEQSIIIPNFELDLALRITYTTK